MDKKETILIADDSEINRAILQTIFEKDYNLLEAENGIQVMSLLEQYSESITAVLLDLVMPEKNGYRVLEEMQDKEWLFHIPVIVITAEDSSDSKVRVFKLGASDIITKPFDPDVVESRVKNIIELGHYRRHLEALVEEHSARARESSNAVIDMLSSVIEHRHMESGQHIRRIRMFTKILLEKVAESYQEYGLDEHKIRLITDASSMHDIGKIAIPDSVLNKPGPLTPEEFEIMKTHTIEGCEMLQGLDRIQDAEYLQYAYDICRHHHERWNGAGYPDGLKENNIPICAQVVSIADCYDALTTERVYKKAVSHSKAFNMIMNGECGEFSPRLLECFKAVSDEFARLAKEYADGLVPEPVSEGSAQPLQRDLTNNAFEMERLKYYALLRYVDCTVIEGDVVTNEYHLAYLSDQDFSALRSGGSLEESIRIFAESSAHPADRADMLKIVSEHIEKMYSEGMMQCKQKYRILDRATGNYVWCSVSIVKINLDNPRARKVMLVWQKERAAGDNAQQQEERRAPGLMLGGLLKCANDKYFTILEMNQSLTRLVGYTEQEIAEKFNNHLIELVHPDDRENMLDEYYKQREVSKLLQLEYRLVNKDGAAVWVCEQCSVMDENDEEAAYISLVDVTKHRQVEEEAQAMIERYQTILGQTNDIIFEWDAASNRISLSNGTANKCGYMQVCEHEHNKYHIGIHPRDLALCDTCLEDITAENPYKEFEFRLADEQGEYRWRRIRLTAFFDGGRISKVVGLVLDIDDIKKMIADITDTAARDSLTGLYTKKYARELIENCLAARSTDGISALMLIELSDYKLINDRFGREFGENVVKEASERVSEMFHGGDIIARADADLFMVFMPTLYDEGAAEYWASETICAVQKLILEKTEDAALTCNVGVAVSRGCSEGFEELFHQADMALCRAKAKIGGGGGV